ncbi:MAG TPA: AsmA family protein [Verrucomicrobiae bacterium]|nr:AsmA family protein [Verrucomicrobiae bacterium]
MAEATVNSPAPRKRRSFLRIIALIVGILILLVVVTYFVGTSSAFLKAVILPKAGKSLNAQITVSDASISPFSQVVLKNLKIQTTGSEPLVSAPEVRLRYSLMDIIRKHINIDEVTLVSPTVVLIENPDGSSNLDPILNSQKKSEEPAKPSAPSQPLQINIKKVALTDATVRQVKLYKGPNRDTTELSHVNFDLENLQNGQTAKLTLGADIKMENNPPAPAASGVLQAKLTGNFTLALTTDLKPGSVQGNSRLEVSRAEGSLAQAASLAASLNCDITPTDIKQVALRFEKSGASLGQVLVTGPFSLEKNEGRVSVQVFGIDKNLLNVAGSASGVDFGPTTIQSTNTIEIANAGKNVNVSGEFSLAQLQITLTNTTTPPLNLSANYEVAVNLAASNATLRTFTVSGTQKGNQLLHGELTSPMAIAWGAANSTVADSTLSFVISHLDLADWKAFAGAFAPAGDFNMKLQLLSQQAGKQLTFDLSSDINNLTAGSGSNQITQAAVNLQVKGKATDLNQFEMSDYKLAISRQNQSLLTVSGSGTYDKSNQVADVQVRTEVLVAKLLQALPRGDIKASSGTLTATAHVTQKKSDQNVKGNLALSDLSAQVGSNVFQNFGITADLDLGITANQVQIRTFAGKLTQSNKDGGAFELSGTYGLSNRVAQLTAKLNGFNENGLRTFLEPMLADKKLTSVAINGHASVQYDPNLASSIKADLQMTNLVVSDPKGQFPAKPLEARCQLDASIKNQVTDIRQAQLALTPTSRATNSIGLTGQVDMTRTNAITGNLKLAADALDLTSYYDLFGGQNKTAPARSQPTSQPAPATSSATANEGSQTNQLPLKNFTVDASIHKLYLREVEVSDFQLTTKIDGGHIVVNPCKLTLNGAPMQANVDLDMGVPGYKYGLTFNAQSVPLTPLVNTFQPERKGQLGGTFTAQAKIDGVGTSGESLQKNLTGQFDMGSTNLNLSVVDVKSPVIKTIVNVVATIPELLRNPEGAVGSLLQGLTGQSKGSLTDELTKSPINSIIARGNVASGKVNLQQALIQSPAFTAEAVGTVTLAAVLTNSSINIPVAVSLSQSIARRINLVSADTPTNAAYVKLPNFVTETGTIGEPKAQVNKLALLSLAAKGIGGALPIGGTAGNLIQGLGALGGNAGSGTNAASSSNKVGGLLQGLGGLLGGKPQPTNSPSQPSQQPTNQPPQNQPVNNLLNDLFKPKK